MIKSMNHNSLGCKQPYITHRPRCKNGSHPMRMYMYYSIPSVDPCNCLIFLAVQGMAEFYSGQARYKQLVAAKDGKYRMLAKSKESRGAERERQLEKLRSLQAVVNKLESDFPATRDHLQTVSASLSARLSELRQKVVEVA